MQSSHLESIIGQANFRKRGGLRSGRVKNESSQQMATRARSQSLKKPKRQKKMSDEEGEAKMEDIEDPREEEKVMAEKGEDEEMIIVEERDSQQSDDSLTKPPITSSLRKLEISKKPIKKKKPISLSQPAKTHHMDALYAKKEQECFDYVFNRLKHPQLDAITEDSIAKCLNDFEVLITPGQKGNPMFDAKVLKEMMKMAGLEQGQKKVDKIDKEKFRGVYASTKVKVDGEGRVI